MDSADAAGRVGRVVDLIRLGPGAVHRRIKGWNGLLWGTLRVLGERIRDARVLLGGQRGDGVLGVLAGLHPDLLAGAGECRRLALHDVAERPLDHACRGAAGQLRQPRLDASTCSLAGHRAEDARARASRRVDQLVRDGTHSLGQIRLAAAGCLHRAELCPLGQPRGQLLRRGCARRARAARCRRKEAGSHDVWRVEGHRVRRRRRFVPGRRLVS